MKAEAGCQICKSELAALKMEAELQDFILNILSVF